jgi:hypothetical protein
MFASPTLKNAKLLYVSNLHILAVLVPDWDVLLKKLMQKQKMHPSIAELLILLVLTYYCQPTQVAPCHSLPMTYPRSHCPLIIKFVYQAAKFNEFAIYNFGHYSQWQFSS